MRNYLIWLTIMFCLVWVTNAITPVEYWLEKWANVNLVNDLWNACQDAVDPVHCFGIWLSISNAESGMCRNQTSHWCFWLVWSKWDKSPEDRKTRYKRYWYKWDDWFYFYWDRWKLAPTRYCTSEHSSNTKIWCPNWKNNFNKIRYDYKTRVMTDKLYTPPLDSSIEILDDWYKKECTRVADVRADQYVQVDSWLWILLNIFRPKEKSKVFICNNI
jgi:hypothetical protein